MSVYHNFIAAFNALEESGMITSRVDAASKLGYKPQAFTEILKGRSGISVELMQKFSSTYAVNPEFLLFGQGAMFYSYQTINSKELIVEEPKGSYGTCRSCAEKEKIIEEKEATIQALKLAIYHLTK